MTPNHFHELRRNTTETEEKVYKESQNNPDTPSSAAPRSDIETLLDYLWSHPAPPNRSSRRTKRSPYERVVARIALGLAALTAGGIWWVGGYFTLVWVAQMGIPVVTLGVAAWIIPLAITTLEMGMLHARPQSRWAWLCWGSVFLIDITTTAQGLMVVGQTHALFGEPGHHNDVTVWILGGLLGIAIAVIPEPALRSIWRDLRRT
jgi:hypothetical protein